MNVNIQALRDCCIIFLVEQGAQELTKAITAMKDLGPMLPQMRLFLNFLDSMLEEQNFKMNLLILDIYGVLVDRLKAKCKPHLR